jgi:hypothetical protein
MPPRRATRNTRAKAPATLSPEDQQLRDQCNLLLADFDKQCENLKAEAVREAKAAADSIATLYRLEMMKIPMETKVMKWEDYYEQNSRSALGLSKAVAEAVDDSVMEAVDTQVEVIKTAIKNTTVKKAARKKRAGYGDENVEPPTVTRTSSRRRVISKTHSDSALETPATSSRSRAQVLETPANNRFHMHPLQTPMVTPKFDTTQLSRTVSRVAKAGEVLMSLSGSPVAPAVSARTKAGKELSNQNALIPLGGGNTLNMPLEETDLGIDLTAELDNEQMARLELLHRNIGNMLKMKTGNMTMGN